MHFPEESTKGIQNDGFLFPFSEDSIKGIQNSEFRFPFLRQKQNRKLNLPAGSLVPRLSPHTNGAWKRGYPPGVSSRTWLVTFDLKIFIHWLVIT